MDERALRDIGRRLDALERGTPRLRIGTATDDNPLSVALGGADTAYTAVRSAGARPAVGDRVSCLAAGGDLIVLGTISNGSGPSWSSPTLSSGWTDYGATDATRRLGYSRSPSGWVQLRGDADRHSTTWTVPDVMFTLPVGLRPATVEHIYLVAMQNGTGSGMARVRVSADGSVSLRAAYVAWSGPGINLISLDQVGFWAEQ